VADLPHWVRASFWIGWTWVLAYCLVTVALGDWGASVGVLVSAGVLVVLIETAPRMP
jgi:hypothetical protein